jgi:hypothetical protein
MTHATLAAPRNHVPLFALLGANVASMVGNMTAMIALPWFVLATARSASKTGLAGFSIDWFGLIPTISFVAALYLTATVSMLLIPVLRDMNRPVPEHLSANSNLVTQGKGALS